MRERAETIYSRKWQIGSMADKSIRFGRRTRSETYRRGLVGQIVAPIFAVLRELFARTIGGVIFQQNSERAKGLVMRASIDAELGVDPCQPARHQPHAEGVHDDVMIARIPKEPIRRSFEQGEPEQRSASWLNRSRQISLHPCFGRGPRISLGADIDHRH